MQLKGGAVGITCQKLSEAEIMVQAGIRDIFLPYNLIVRLESAWNEAGRQQWILDLNVDI